MRPRCFARHRSLLGRSSISCFVIFGLQAPPECAVYTHCVRGFLLYHKSCLDGKRTLDVSKIPLLIASSELMDFMGSLCMSVSPVCAAFCFCSRTLRNAIAQYNFLDASQCHRSVPFLGRFTAPMLKTITEMLHSAIIERRISVS